MRVLFTCLPFTGHLYPLVPVARALAAAGHDVAFAVPAYFTSTVEGAGFRSFPVGLAQPIPERYPRWRDLPGPERGTFWQAVFADLWPRHTIPDLLTLATTWPPDLLVREETAYSGCLAAEILGLPHASVDIDAAGHPSGDSAWLVAPLNRQRAAHGLAPDPDLAMLRRYLTLHPFPPTFLDPDGIRPPTTHCRSATACGGWCSSASSSAIVAASIISPAWMRPNLQPSRRWSRASPTSAASRNGCWSTTPRCSSRMRARCR